MSLVEHAKRELTLNGQYEEDPAFAESLINAVEAFAEYGHSGGSASAGIYMLNELLQFKPLSPIGKSSEEWVNVTDDDSVHSGAEVLWQNSRRSTTFSRDGGKTWYDIDDPSENNGDEWYEGHTDDYEQARADRG
jgi:hypothetical protein